MLRLYRVCILFALSHALDIDMMQVSCQYTLYVMLSIFRLFLLV